jgi:ATP-dependent phosphoenolpyruvate carboxykinase
MFRSKLRENPNVNVWLVNTGFNSKLERFPLKVTRGVINGVIDGEYDTKDFIFYNELQVPNQVGEFSMNDIFEKPDERRQEHFFDMIKNSH